MGILLKEALKTCTLGRTFEKNYSKALLEHYIDDKRVFVSSNASLIVTFYCLKQIPYFVFRIVCLTKTKQKDKQSSAMLEKKTRAETEARLCVEKQLADLQAQKLEEAANTARSLTSR